MKNVKKILLSNAYISWSNAIKYHNYIYSGRATLNNQKVFISSLHNAVELFLKQIMLDKNDKEIAYVNKKCKPIFPALESDYNQSTDLNSFFGNLSINEINAFHSIQFGSLIKKHVSLLKLQNNGFTDFLTLIQELRNSETHFYINNNLLNEGDFCKMHNFMLLFYEELGNNDLLPFWGEPNREYSKLHFTGKNINSFPYIDALRNNPLSKVVVDTINNNNELFNSKNINSYHLFSSILYEETMSNYDSDEILDICDMLFRLNCISFTEFKEDFEPEYIPEYGYVNPNHGYLISVNL